MRLFYTPEYAIAGSPVDTHRKAILIAASLAVTPAAGAVIATPAPLSRAEFEHVHDPAYVEAVSSGRPRLLAESNDIVPWVPEIWSAARWSCGGAASAAVAAMADGVAGSLSSGFHHARYGHGKGYCTFNGLVLAARRACAAGATRVLILDLDAHWGGGTVSLVAHDERVWVVDVSVNDYDEYAVAPPNVLKRRVSDGSRYLDVIAAELHRAAALPWRFDLCLYNAGMDVFEHCRRDDDPDIAGLSGVTASVLRERERMVFDWCRSSSVPVAFVLAGGYVGPEVDERALVDLHRLTIEAAASS